MPVDQLDLLVDNPALQDAVSTVLDRTNGGEDEVQWTDVRDSLSSGEWGRLIESGVLVSGANGFVISNPEHLRQGLDQQTSDPTDVDPRTWEWYDKAAGVTALVLFTGYWNTGVRDVIASVDNVVLGPVTSLLPFHVVVLLLAVATGLYSTLLQARLTDNETLEAYRARMDRLNERLERAKERNDQEAIDRIKDEQLDAAGDQLSLFKVQFRPMVWIMLLTVPVFLWLRWKVRGGHLGGASGLVVPLAGAVTWQQPLVGPMPTWIVWYFLCSLAARQIVQKGFGIQPRTSSTS